MSCRLSCFTKRHSCSLISGDNVEVDYRGYEVTVENLVRLLTGRLPATVPRYGTVHIIPPLIAELRIRIRICRIQMFLGLPDPHPDPLIREMDPDPSIVKQK